MCTFFVCLLFSCQIIKPRPAGSESNLAPYKLKECSPQFTQIMVEINSHRRKTNGRSDGQNRTAGEGSGRRRRRRRRRRGAHRDDGGY